ncbi:hypothetical protein PoB_004571000 [Plakobranchus ocellatus]|uniref:Uncharacterized protein n=1 Tax=Plakobranchus ocellatus TaxID=259542 RepID=A0AAV4BI62_9GAST|nr:hypothetical protein PoB_004571000 [Plakobranchus ocellatus]
MRQTTHTFQGQHSDLVWTLHTLTSSEKNLQNWYNEIMMPQKENYKIFQSTVSRSAFGRTFAYHVRTHRFKSSQGIDESKGSEIDNLTTTRQGKKL